MLNNSLGLILLLLDNNVRDLGVESVIFGNEQDLFTMHDSLTSSVSISLSGDFLSNSSLLMSSYLFSIVNALFLISF